MKKSIFKSVWLGILLSLLFSLTASEAIARKSRKITFSDDDAARIRGKIIRPELELVLQRSKINYDALKLEESFLPRIKQSTKDTVFK